MNVKVKANVSLRNMYSDNSECVAVYYTYKADGFKKYDNKKCIISRYDSESHTDYTTRMLEELRTLTKEEVINIVKNSIISNLKFRIASHTREEEKKRLLKELNKIKFSFTITEKL